jgi:uncharacterized membrane protein
MKYNFLRPKESEDKIFLIGVLLLTLLLLIYLVSMVFYTAYVTTLLNMTLTNATLGRMASLSLGIAKEIESLPLILFTLLLEMIQVFLLYPLFVKSWYKVSSLKSQVLQNYFTKAKISIEKYQPLLHRYGILGLLFFVLTPLAMTGPVVGSFAGFIIGFRHRKTLSVIFIATSISMGLWYYLIIHFEEHLVAYSSWVTPLLLLAIGGVAIWYMLKRVWVR